MLLLVNLAEATGELGLEFLYVGICPEGKFFDYSLSRLPVDGLLTGPFPQGMPYTLWSKWSSPRTVVQFGIYHHLKQISLGSLWTWAIYLPFASVTSV